MRPVHAQELSAAGRAAAVPKDVSCAGERRAPVPRGVAGPWRGQRRSLARLSVRCHPSAPLPCHLASVSRRGAAPAALAGGPGGCPCP